MALPPLFYILTAEKDKIKNLKQLWFNRGSVVDPLHKLHLSERKILKKKKQEQQQPKVDLESDK